MGKIDDLEVAIAVAAQKRIKATQCMSVGDQIKHPAAQLIMFSRRAAWYEAKLAELGPSLNDAKHDLVPVDRIHPHSFGPWKFLDEEKNG